MKRVQPSFGEINCGICYQQYNKADKQPMVVCSNRHSICRYCLEQLESLLCPFCRQVITMVVVNDSIQNLLPSHSPNQRVPIYNQPFLAPISNNQLVTYYRQNELLIESDYQQYQLEETCYERLIAAVQKHMQMPVFYALLVQLPFVIFDLLFSKLNSDYSCMDKQYQLPVTARQLFFVNAIAGVSLTLTYLLIIIFSSCCLDNPHLINCLEYLVLFVLYMKLVVWMVAEPLAYLVVVKDHCSGLFYTYCFIQTLIFGFVLAFGTIVVMCKR